MPIGCIARCSGKENPWQNSEKKIKICLDSKRSCLQNNAHWPSVYSSPFTIHTGISQQELFRKDLVCWESVNVTVHISG